MKLQIFCNGQLIQEYTAKYLLANLLYRNSVPNAPVLNPDLNFEFVVSDKNFTLKELINFNDEG